MEDKGVKKDKHAEDSTSGSVSCPSTRLLSVCTPTKHHGGKNIQKTIKRHNQESLEEISRTCIFAKRQNSKQFAWKEMFDIETTVKVPAFIVTLKLYKKTKL